MSASLLGQLFSSLYSLVKEEAKVKRKMTRTRAGHLFENVTAQKIYSHARSLGLRPNPPRHTLSYPTFSGGSYQFDASFSLGDVTYVIECKRTKMPAKVHIHYFNSQILDYLFGAISGSRLMDMEFILKHPRETLGALVNEQQLYEFRAQLKGETK